MSTFSHVGICVSDIGRSLDFYLNGLEAREFDLLEFGSVLPPGYHKLLETPNDVEGFAKFVVIDDLLIELLHYHKQDGEPGHVGMNGRRPLNNLGFTHFGLRIESREDHRALLARVRAHGGTVLDDSFTAWHYGEHFIEAVFVVDPDGTRWEIACTPKIFAVGGAVRSSGMLIHAAPVE